MCEIMMCEMALIVILIPGGQAKNSYPTGEGKAR
jgi:hypothetical protein